MVDKPNNKQLSGQPHVFLIIMKTQLNNFWLDCLQFFDFESFTLFVKIVNSLIADLSIPLKRRF